MTDQEFQQKLDELMGQIETAPEDERPRLRELAEETRARQARMKKIIGELQESLDYLRLSVKYLVFDLEATRRENQYLRRMINGDAGPRPDADSEH